MKKGKFYGIGIGPGCSDLITVKGAELIKKADIIYVPTKNTIENSIAYKTILPYIKKALIKPAKFSMSYDKNILNKHRNTIIKEIKNDILNGKEVVFVTLGDPLLYSTYVYILNGLKKAINNLFYETIPGITSFSAMAAKSDTPLVEEDEILTIYPATYFSKDIFNKIYDTSDSIILMKIPKKSSEIINFVKEKKFSKIVHMKNICIENEKLSYDLEDKSLNNDEEKKYLSIILLKK